jgi:hypothetical protein
LPNSWFVDILTDYVRTYIGLFCLNTDIRELHAHGVSHKETLGRQWNDLLAAKT